ncbi:MAG: iron ABC transporter permease [Paludibacteraceae bacterium]|nr:iron ABC transporter permease [Paludibacteraceae bacterium]
MKNTTRFFLFLLLLLLFAGAFVFDLTGLDISALQLLDLLKGAPSDGSPVNDIVTQIRLPKAITAILCGAGLSVAGLLMQTLFRNPLAGPYVLGISSGAGLGVALVVMGASFVPFLNEYGAVSQVVAATLGALLVLMLVLLVSTRIHDTVSLLIIGMMLGSLTGAIVNVLQTFSNPDALKVYIMWTMGSLANVSNQQLGLMVPPMLVGFLLAILIQKPLNALLLGENYARSMGVSVRFIQTVIILTTCLLAGVSTAFTGPIAFIGIAVPHIVRGLFNSSDHRIVLPASILFGATLLLVCDIVSCLPHYSLPINSMCAVVGAPIIIWVIIKNKKIQQG